MPAVLTRHVGHRSRAPLAAVLCLWLAWAAATAQPVRVTAADALRPFGPPVERLLRQAGVASPVEYLPAARSLALISGGESDVEFPRTRFAVEGFAGSVDLAGPIACIELVAWARADSAVRLSNAGDLTAYRGGVQLGNRLAQGVATDQRMRVDAVPTRDSLYRMLDAGRIDVVLDSELNGRAAIQALQLDHRVVRVGPVLHHEPTFVVVRRRVDGLAARLDKELQAMKASGEWLRLLGDVNASLGIARDSGVRCLLPSAPGASSTAPPAGR